MISQQLAKPAQADDKYANKPKSSIILPEEIAKINSTLETRVNELAEAYTSLSQSVKSKDYYFSVNRLHEAVKTKPEESKQLLEEIENEKQKITKLIDANESYWKSIYQTHLDNVSKKREELNTARLDLLNALDKYQRRMDENKIHYDESKAKTDKFNKAKIEFNRIKDKSSSYLFGLNDQGRKQAYEQFKVVFSEVAKLENFDSKSCLFTTCTPLVSLQLPNVALSTSRVPPSQEIFRKQVPELKQIAVKTNDPVLAAQAAKLEQLNNEVSHQNILPAINITALKTDSGDTCKTLLVQARIMIATYKMTKKELLTKSKLLFQKIDHQVEGLCQQIETARLGLNAIRKMFLSTSPQMRIYLINNFDKLVEQFKSASNVYQLSIGQSQQIIENYKTVCADFDVDHSGWEDSNKRKMNLYKNELNEAMKEAKQEIFRNRGNINKTKQEVAAQELLNCIRYMIQNRVGYWNDQVFSSDYKIGNLKVPHGIADMHSHLLASKDNSVWETLKAIKEVAVSRKAASTGWFFKRTMTTTDKFYGIIQGVVLQDLTIESITDLKKRFMEIPGLIEPERPLHRANRPPAIMTRR